MTVASGLAKEVAKTVVARALCALGGAEAAFSEAIGNSFLAGGEAQQRRKRKYIDALGLFCPVPEPPLDRPIPPPFSGGQCPISYAVVIRRFINLGRPGESFTDSTRSVIGPVGGVEKRGTAAVLVSGSPDVDLGSWGDRNNYFVVSATPAGGGVDSCGNNPGGTVSYPRINPRPEVPSPTVELSPTLIVPVLIAPVIGYVSIDVDGRLIMPVDVNLNYQIGPREVNLSFPIDIDLSDPDSPPRISPRPRRRDGGGRPYYPDCAYGGDCGTEPPVVSPDVDPPEEEEPDDVAPLIRRVIKSAIVSCTVNKSIVRATEIEFSPGPKIWAPRLGNFRFSFKPSVVGPEVWSADIPIKGLSQVIPTPSTGLTCTGGAFYPEPGVSGTVEWVRGVDGCQ